MFDHAYQNYMVSESFADLLHFEIHRYTFFFSYTVKVRYVFVSFFFLNHYYELF